MSIFSAFKYEIVKLIKRDGSIIDNIKALVQPKTIFVEDASICFDEDDIIERKLPNNKIESYRIVDPVFYDAFGGEPAHYQIKVEKTTTHHKASSVQIFASENAKVMIDSVDNSINVNSQDFRVFDELIDVVKGIQGNSEMIASIIQMKNSVNDKESFRNKYIRFVQIAADHMTLLAPFIPSLTRFLS